MIREQAVLEQLNADWEAIEEMLTTARWSWTEIEVAPGLLEFTRDIAIMAANLCVLFAMGVLERALLQLRDEKVFESSGLALSSLMMASRSHGLPWVNFDLIDQLRRKRNSIAHSQTRFPEDECLVMISAIKAELQSWSALKSIPSARP